MTTLLSLGVQGVAVTSADQTLQTATSLPGIEGIIVDVEAASLGGDALVEALKGSEQTAGIPLVVYSSQSNRSSVIRMMELGVAAYLLKPYDQEKASAQLKRVLERVDKHFRERRHIRVQPDQNELLRVHFHVSGHKGLVSGRVLDVSMGGLATELFTAPADYLMQPGRPIRDITMNLLRRQIICSGFVVKFARKLCALRFEKMKKEDSEILARYIYLHISK